MSKNLILAIAGAFVSWFVISFFTRNYDSTFLFTLIIGIFLGYEVKKREKQ